MTAGPDTSGPDSTWLSLEGEHAVDGFGSMRFVAVDPDEDAALIHSWVSEERAAFWGMRGADVEEVRATYAHLDALATHHAFLVLRDDRPAALVQTYDPAEDRVGLCYPVAAGDIGLHLLVAPARRPEPGFTGAVIAATVAQMFAVPSRRRIVAEPDARNEKAIARLVRSGFTRGAEVTLPEIDLPEVFLPAKRAVLTFLSRGG